MRFSDVLVPLMLAALVPSVIVGLLAGQWSIAVGLWVMAIGWLIILVCVAVCVLPIMAFRPALRRPSFAVAAVWGAATGAVSQLVAVAISDSSWRRLVYGWDQLGTGAVMGLISGVSYIGFLWLRDRRRRSPAVQAPFGS